MKKQCKGVFEGTLPKREIVWYLKAVKINEKVAELMEGYADDDIRQLYLRGTIKVLVSVNFDRHTYKVEVFSNDPSLNAFDIAKRIAKSYLSYEEALYKECLSDASWQQLRGKAKLKFKFLKGDLWNKYAEHIENHNTYVFWLLHFVQELVCDGIIGVDIKVHHEDRSVEITTYVKDMERAYERTYDIERLENLLYFVANDIAIAYQRWELTVCNDHKLFKEVVNG